MKKLTRKQKDFIIEMLECTEFPEEIEETYGITDEEAQEALDTLVDRLKEGK